MNALVEAEADWLCNAQRYERSEARRDTRAGHYERKLKTKAGEVRLRIPKLRQQTFETAIIGRVEGWRASKAGASSSATFPAPSTSHAACGFPALRAPICFTSRLMGPITLGQLSVRRGALDSR